MNVEPYTVVRKWGAYGVHQLKVFSFEKGKGIFGIQIEGGGADPSIQRGANYVQGGKSYFKVAGEKNKKNCHPQDYYHKIK